MLTNKQKYDYYVRALNIIEDGWTKKTLESYSGSVCTVGAINKAVSGDAERMPYHTKVLSRELQEDFLRSMPRRFITATHSGAELASGDGGLMGIENWNDVPWRRKGTVVRRMRERIAYYKPLADAEEIARLEQLVASLRLRINQLHDRIKELELRVAQLENQNSYLRKSKTKYTAEELRNESEALRKLDDELNEALSGLRRYGVDA